MVLPEHPPVRLRILATFGRAYNGLSGVSGSRRQRPVGFSIEDYRPIRSYFCLKVCPLVKLFQLQGWFDEIGSCEIANLYARYVECFLAPFCLFNDLTRR